MFFHSFTLSRRHWLAGLCLLLTLALCALRPAQAAPKVVLISGSEMDSTIQSYLSSLGYSSTIVSPANLGTVSFSGYSAIWLGWSTTFTGLAARRSDLITFMNGGGNVLAEYADSGNALTDYPFGSDLAATGSGGNSVFITDLSSPVNAGLTDAGLTGWNSSYHNTFSTITGFSGITDTGTSGQWVTITKAVGAGNLIYTGQDISYHIKNGSGATGPTSPKGVFLDNALSLTRTNPVPVITNINPTSAFAGDGGFTLTVDGTGFVDGDVSVVYWNGSPLTTTFVGPNELLASVPPSLVASVGTASITVVTNGPGGGTSNAAGFTIYGSAGIDVSPNVVYQGAPSFGQVSLSAPAPSGGLTLSLSSSDPSVASVPSSVTVPAGHTSASFPVATFNVTSDTTISLTVSLGGTSSSTPFTVKTQYTVTGKVTLGGSGLANVVVRGQANGTFTYTRYTTPHTTIPAGGSLLTDLSVTDPGTIADLRVGVDITHPNVGDLRVSVIAPDGTTVVLQDYGASTDANLLTDYPVLSSPAQSLAVFGGLPVAGTWHLLIENAGGSTGTLNLFHLNFTYSGTLTRSGKTASDGTYTVKSLKAETYKFIPTLAGYVFSPTSKTITVGPSATGSNFTAFAIPVLTGLSPSSAYAGSGALTLTVTGTGFVSGSKVVWNSAALTTTYVSSTKLTASVPASLLTDVGTAEVLVANPAPGGSSNILLFSVQSALSGLSLSTSTVAGGASLTGTVTLNGPAPSGGQVISLSSSSAAASVPSSVTVAAGATSASFTVTTHTVSSNTTVTIAASGAGATKTASLLVTAPVAAKLSTLSVSPTSVFSGATPTGTVTLTAAAPAGGVTLTLASSDTTIATVPSTVTVPAGATSASFPVTTKSVSGTRTVTLSATGGGITKTATLTVRPIQVSEITLSSAIVTGGGSVTATVTLNGPAPSGGAKFTPSKSNVVATVPSSVTVPAGATTATFTVTTTTVSSNTNVTIGAAAGGRTKTQLLTVTAATASALQSLSFNPSTVFGGSVNTTGTVTLTGPAPAGGSVITLHSSSSAITFSASTVTVAAGATSNTFRAYSHHVSSTTTVTVTATLNGVTKTATITVTATAGGPTLSALSFSPTTVTGGSQNTTGTVTLTSPAAADTVVSLGSSSSAISFAASTVTIPAGATSNTFRAYSHHVSNPVTVTVTASLSGVSKTATISVTP